MITYAIKTEESFPGPWLLDGSALRELDEILSRYWDYLVKEQEKKAHLEAKRQVDREIDWEQKFTKEFRPPSEKEYQQKIAQKTKEVLHEFQTHWHTRSEKQIRIFIDKQKYIEVHSFAEALRDYSMISEIPKGLSVVLQGLDIEASIQVGIIGEGYYRKDLEIKSGPSESAKARELFGDLRRWAMNYQLPGWVRWWYRVKGEHWLFYIAFLSAITTVLASFPNPKKSEVLRQARKLLDGGVNSTNMDKAIKYLLMLETDHFPGITISATPIPKWYVITVIVATLVSMVLSFLPSTIIGIGRGEGRIKTWKRWIQFVGVTVPSLIITTVLWPYLLRVLGLLF